MSQESTSVKKGEVRSPALSRWLAGLTPLVLLGILIAIFFVTDPLGFIEAGFPPIEELTIERITLRPGEMIVHVVNGGPEPVTVAQVLVDEAYWSHSIEPGRTLSRLGRATITIPYPWVEGEPHEVTLLTSTGVTFTGAIEVAVETPRPDARLFGVFTLLGVYVGVIPVLLGLLWYPFLREIGRRWLYFFLSLTVGLLLFLGIDTTMEAFETAGTLPSVFQGVGLIGLGAVGTILGLTALGRFFGGAEREGRLGHLWIAYLVAIGIGLHNLGEGLAIGTAYALGEIALGAFLILGFTLHNTTEGLAIVAPIARDRPGLKHLAWLGLIAGGPTIFGAWIGGFSYSPLLGTLFLAVGAGAIFQVIYEIIVQMRQEPEGALSHPVNVAGLLTGLVIMYFTGLLALAS
ncbi:MAG: ZIP family metal transporter [Candidatus Bipolaricaulia bacterium]